MEPKITERCATRVILMSCGSYNPPTHMHLRMFERARDHLHNLGTHMVIGGVISPVNDAYAKKELANGVHRCKMLKLALTDSDWIRLSTWEIRQNTWTRTRKSLQHHQNLIDSVVYGNGDANRNSIDNEDLEWIPENVRNNEIADQMPIRIKLLCGGDLLESFATPGLWAEEDIAEIVGQYGLVVITREGSNPYKFIYDSDILSKHLHNIQIVTEWIPNEVSSTRIRRALKRGESVKYLLQDAVIDYVYTNGIYEAHRPSIIKLELSSINSSIDYLDADEAKYQHNSAFLTSSPSDINMQETTSCNVYTITTMNDISDCVLKKNLQNNYSPTYSDDQSSQNSIVNMYTDREKLLWSMVFDSINIGGESSSSLLQHHNRVFNSIDSPIELPSSARARNELLAFEDTAERELATLYDNTFSEEKEDALLSVAYEGRFDDLNESFVKDNTTFMENFDKFNTENVNATKDETDRESIGCDNSEESDFKTTRFETNFEIDGKYLKSLVNSKKSTKKMEDNESIKLIKEDSKLTVLKSKAEEERESIEMNVEDEPHEEIKLFDDITYVKRLRLIINNKPIEISKNQRQQIQGSLDSINLNEASVMNAADSMTKKSKSLESIKRNAHLLYKTNETSYCDSVLKIKADNTAPLAEASSTLDHQADEYCSSCCFVKTDEHHCPTNCSSPEDEDSTECDICSSYNLQDANDALIREDDGVAQNLSESMEICEICGEPATIADEPSTTNANPVNTINSRSMTLSLPKAKSTIEISRGSYKMSTMEDDHFEIDNCGLQDCKLRASLDMCNKPEPLYVNVTPKYHRFASEIDNRQQPPKIKSDRHLISDSNYYSCNCKSNQGLKYTECKDEAAVSKILLPNGNKRLYRKGSCPKKYVIEKTQDKRRYSSVENLQNKMFFKSDAEILSKSMDNKLMASADSIRSSRLTRCKSLRRSADNVGRFDSLGDNLDSLEENADTDDNGVMTDNNSRCASVNIRDSDTIKMILTKHGIKIISQKETVL